MSNHIELDALRECYQREHDKAAERARSVREVAEEAGVAHTSRSVARAEEELRVWGMALAYLDGVARNAVRGGESR